MIADAFHRTGAVEIWGRGTNRVISECKRYGLEAPCFEELGDALVVTIRVPIGPEAEGNARSRPDHPQPLLLINPVKSEISGKIASLPATAHIEIQLPELGERREAHTAFGSIHSGDTHQTEQRLSR